MKAVDVLDFFDVCNTDTYIDPIKKSMICTKMILIHIAELIKLYKVYRAVRLIREVYGQGLWNIIPKTLFLIMSLSLVRSCSK